MLVIICDECGEPANSLQLQLGVAEFMIEMNNTPVAMKSTSVDLCENHWPEEGATQPKNCKRVKFVWLKGGPPETPFVFAVPLTFSGPYFEEGYDGPVFKQVEPRADV